MKKQEKIEKFNEDLWKIIGKDANVVLIANNFSKLFMIEMVKEIVFRANDLAIRAKFPSEAEYLKAKQKARIEASDGTYER